MLGGKGDVSELKRQEIYTDEPAQDFNTRVDLVIRANSFQNPIFPKPGKMAVGDRGLDYRANSGRGYIQVPWSSINNIQVDIPAGDYVRSIRIFTKDAPTLEFVVSDGKNLVRVLARHLGREKLTQAPQNVQAAGHFLGRKIKGFLERLKGSRSKKK